MRKKQNFQFRSLGTLAGLLLILVSCGGSSGNGPDANVNGTSKPQLTYAEYEAQSRELHRTWDAFLFASPSSLPMSGTAKYSGVVRLDVENGPDEISLNGKLKMQIDFRTNSITGSARDFVDEGENSYDGKLRVSNGLIDRSADRNVDYTLRADLTGKLKGAGDKFDISADMLGDFHRSSGAAVSGEVQGTAISSFGTGYVFGDFIAEK